MDNNTILNNDDMTFSEKIITLRSQTNSPLRAGDITVIEPDLVFSHDGSSPAAIIALEKMGIEKLWNPRKTLIVIDHTYPAADEKVAGIQALVRNFAFKHGAIFIEGSITHQHVLEEYVVPGMIVFGGDSHTTQHGGVGAFGTGVGSTEIASIWASGKTWVRVPETIKVNLNGKLKKGVFARDIIMNFIGLVGEDGGAYRALEWTGSTIPNLNIEDRCCISNSSMECGSKLSIFESDDITRSYMKEVNRKPIMEISPGSDATYLDDIEIDCEELEPQVTVPHNADNVKEISNVLGIPVDQAFIGSAANGKIGDLEIAARILKNKKVKTGTRCVITPASRRVYEEAIRRGYVEIFLESGAIFTNANCGACIGTHMGVLAEKEVCISTSTRNYVGRMGSTSAEIYLSSPATAAASAIEGKIADPRDYL